MIGRLFYSTGIEKPGITTTSLTTVSKIIIDFKMMMITAVVIFTIVYVIIIDFARRFGKSKLTIQIIEVSPPVQYRYF